MPKTGKALLFVSCMFFFMHIPSYVHAQKIGYFQSLIYSNAEIDATSFVSLADGGYMILGTGVNDNISTTYLVVCRTDSLGRPKWVKKYGKINYPLAGGKIIMSPDSNFVFCGIKADSFNLSLTKIDKNGTVIWSRTYGDSGNSETGMDIANDPNGGFLVTGNMGYNSNSSFYINSLNNILAIKTDNDGNLVWSNIYTGPTYNYALSSVRASSSPDGGYIILGQVAHDTENASTGGYGGVLFLKIDENGSLIWSKAYGDSSFQDFYYYLSVLPDKSIYAFGYTSEHRVHSFDGEDWCLMALDSNGKFQWAKSYATANDYIDKGEGILYSPARNGFYITGYSWNDNTGYISFRLGITDLLGRLTYFKQYTDNRDPDSAPISIGGSTIIEEKHGLAFLGATATTNNIGAFCLIKADPTGNTNKCNLALDSVSYSSYKLDSLSFPVYQAQYTMDTSSGVTVSSLSAQVTSICPPFLAGFGWQGRCAENPIHFSDSTYQYPKSWAWNFGDSFSTSNTSKLQNPVHFYNKEGSYLVRLISSNGTDTDTAFHKITILPSPVIFALDTMICKGATATLRASGGQHYLWQPGSAAKDSADTFVVSPKITTTWLLQSAYNNGCMVDDTFKVSVDSNPGPPLTLNATVISYGEIDLVFRGSDSGDVSTYTILRSVDGGTYTQINTVSRNNSNLYIYEDQTVSANSHIYAYKVVGANPCGKVTDSSGMERAVLLKGSGGDLRASLTWTKYGGETVDSQAVERYDTLSRKWVTLGYISKTDSAYTDSTYVKCDKPVNYRIAGFLNDSQVSYSDSVMAIPFETYFRDTPQIITATKTITSTTNGASIIRWKSNNTHVTYNDLYYATDGLNFSLLQSHIPVVQDSFVHTGINTQTADEYYYLVATDSCPAQSAKSVIHKTMTLTVSVGELLHKLNWTPYKGFKVENYIIQKLTGGNFQPYDTVSGTDTFTSFFPAPCNHVERYRIEAVGYSPGEISLSDSMGRKALDTIPPNPAKITSLTVLSANNVQLNFISSDSPDVYQYVVQRAVNGIWGTASDFITHLHGVTSSFMDSVNTTSNTLCYTIITLDSCLNAAQSDTICAEELSGKALNCNAEVTLNLPKITAPPTEPDSFVVYRSTDNINYNKIIELPVTDNTDLDTDVIANTTYYYKLEGVYKSAGMGTYSDTIRVVPKIIPDADSAQLVYATVLKSDETHGDIYIQWRRAALNDTNARGYYVYSYNTANGKYALLQNITNLNDTNYIQENINTIQDAYKYYIVTYNVCDVGINSNIHKTVLLTVQNNNLEELLNWTNYLGIPVKNYSVYKSEDGGGQYLLSNVGLDSAYSDSNITCNHDFTYQIQAMLANGEISFSDSITVKSYDTIKPVTKPILFATILESGLKDGRIKLDWNPAFDKNLAGYNVYRSIDGLYWSLIIDHWPGTSLIDTGLNTYRQSYYYKIQPVDSCGNTGDFTIYHETMQLKASAGNGFNELSWNGYAGWMVQKYLVYRNGVLIDTVASNVFSFKDTAVICKNIYQYLIKAIDNNNDTIISSSNTDSAKAINHIPPQKVYIKTVTVSNPNKAATITWIPSSSYDVKNYFIYRKSPETGNFKFVDSTVSLTYTDSFRDIPAAIRQIRDSDCYYVFARDHCGNQSDGSNQGCIIILNAQNQQGYNQLTWNSYQSWADGVQSYNVYKNEDSTGWQLIGTTSPPAPLLKERGAFTDSKLGDSVIDFCYQVEAVENPGQYNQLSRSTVVCIHQDATVFIPNSFTPYNEDGLNDYFAPQGVYIKSYDMKIYNRWGEQVYASPQSSKNPPGFSPGGEGAGWDGKFQGQYVQQGVYIYLITVTDYNGRQSYFKGTITMFE